MGGRRFDGVEGLGNVGMLGGRGQREGFFPSTEGFFEVSLR